MSSVSLLPTAGSLRPRSMRTSSCASNAALPLSGPCHHPRAATSSQGSPRFVGNATARLIPSPGIGGRPQVAWKRSERTVKVGAGLPSGEELQSIASLALDPHPGLVAGAACNSLVYLLGIKVLLKVTTTTSPPTAAEPSSPSVMHSCEHFIKQC